MPARETPARDTPAQITGDRLTTLFRPRSVALVGASDKSAFSMLAYSNLVQFGLADRTYLVNRRGVITHGQATARSCQEIGEPVDVAFLMVPQAGTLEALSDAAAAGIRNALVLSAGYGEAGEAGRAAQAELAAHAESLGMVLLGPNHLGFANLTEGIPVTSVPGLPRVAGPVALLSQSGASSSAMLDFATMVNVGLSYLVTLGNEAMITAGHVLDFLVDDPGTRAVAIFMETIRNPEVFRRAARRAAAAGKAIVVLKAGSSALSARTAAAHTGALVGDDKVIDAVFAGLGVIRVDSIEDMLITAGAAAALGRLARPGIGIVSISGGACDIVADRAEDLGAVLPEIGEATRDALAAIMPDYGTVQNPLDVTGAAVIDPTIFTRAIGAISRDPAIGVVGVINSIPWIDDGKPSMSQRFVDAIGAGMRDAACPTAYINQVMQPVTGYTRTMMQNGGVSYLIPGLRQAVVALRNVAWWSEATRDVAAPSGEGAQVAAATRRSASGRRYGGGRFRSRPRRCAAASGRRTPPAGCSPGRASPWCPRAWSPPPTTRCRRPRTTAARCASRSSRRRSCTRPTLAGCAWTSRARRTPCGRRSVRSPPRRQASTGRPWTESWSARCARAALSCSSAWSATRSGAPCSRSRSAASSSRCSRTRRSHRCR